MAATLCLKLLPKQGWLPLTQSVRHGSKAVTRHRRPMHFIKQKLMAVTQYIPPKPAAPPGAYPSPTKRVQEESGLMLLMKREVDKVFQDSKMIAVGQNNSCISEDMMIFKHKLHKHGISVKIFPNQGELVSGLSLMTAHTSSMLQRHPAHLSALLQQYIRQQSPDGAEDGVPKAEEAS
ncbi:unnamed protein product [Lampetra planeri]